MIAKIWRIMRATRNNSHRHSNLIWHKVAKEISWNFGV